MGNELVEEDREAEASFSNQQHGGHALYSANRESKLKKEKYRLDPIPITYIELFPHLFVNHLIKSVVLKPLTPPFPKWYDPNAHCKYHARISSHSIENCTPFKYKLQRLVRSSALKFDELGIISIFYHTE
ncbi:hypothetical protein CRYUN_Cryun32bG0016100 [Craigia yunnanensis]